MTKPMQFVRLEDCAETLNRQGAQPPLDAQTFALILTRDCTDSQRGQVADEIYKYQATFGEI